MGKRLLKTPRGAQRWAARAALVALPLVACGGGRDVFPEAEALEQAGKLEEAATRFELACLFAGSSDRCAQGAARAFEARMKAGEAEAKQGQYLRAERTMVRAGITADEAQRKRIQDRVEADDIAAGVRYERAIALGDATKAVAAVEPIAAGNTPVAAKAKDWLAGAAAAALALTVKAACGPDHAGSCSESAAKLQASGGKGPEVDEALRMAEAEARRIAPLRSQAEAFLRVFATAGQKEKAFDKCMTDKEAEHVEKAIAYHACDTDAFGSDPDDKKYQARKTNENLFRRLLKQIADPTIAKDLQARKAESFRDGVAKTRDLPKPAPRTR